MPRKNKPSSEYTAWMNVKQRCQNPKASGYRKYGAKGIKLCDNWQSFANFIEDMGPKPTPYHTIDRIDPSKDYTPENCRWATQLEQQNNRSNNRRITAFGKTQTLQQWCRETGMNHKTILRRIGLAWPIEKALSVSPVKGRNQYGNHPI